MIVIKMHKDLVLGYFKNASHMLRTYSEVHANHKTSVLYCKWDIEELVVQSFRVLIERADFKKEDHRGYNNMGLG